MIGQTLSHYRITAALGAGGMGEVYRATDTTLGRDVALRLKRGAVPVDEALEIAGQIAEGLEEAHERGIIHRDLKPANVRLWAFGVLLWEMLTGHALFAGDYYDVGLDGQRFLVVQGLDQGASQMVLVEGPLLREK